MSVIEVLWASGEEGLDGSWLHSSGVLSSALFQSSTELGARRLCALGGTQISVTYPVPARGTAGMN